MASKETNPNTGSDSNNLSIEEKFRRFKEEEIPEGIIEKLEKKKEKINKTGKKNNPNLIHYICATAIIIFLFAFPLIFVLGFLSLVGYVYIAAAMGNKKNKSSKFKLPFLKSAKFRKSFKEDLVSIIIPHFGKELTYKPASGIDKETLNSSLIFPMEGEDLHAEDHISGEVKETKIEISEIMLQNTSLEAKTITLGGSDKRKGDNKTWEKYIKQKTYASMADFVGLFFIADFNKNFTGTTVLRPLNFEWRKEGRKKGKKRKVPYRPSFRTKDPNTNIKLEEVKLEDTEFENLYKIYSSDQVTARYIFSTSMMERVKNFREQWGEKIFMSFKDSYIYLAIPFDNGFLEPDTRGSDPVEKQIEHIFYDLENIFGIVEELKLNQRIWGKD